MSIFMCMMSAPQVGSTVKESGQEMRNWLLRILLFVLLAEQLLAMKLSFHSRQSGVSTGPAGDHSSPPKSSARPQLTGGAA